MRATPGFVRAATWARLELSRGARLMAAVARTKLPSTGEHPRCRSLRPIALVACASPARPACRCVRQSSPPSSSSSSMSAPSNNRRDAGVNAPAAGKAAKTQGDLVQDSFVKQINLISPAKGLLEHDHLVLKGTATGTRRSKRSLPVDAAAGARARHVRAHVSPSHPCCRSRSHIGPASVSQTTARTTSARTCGRRWKPHRRSWRASRSCDGPRHSR